MTHPHAAATGRRRTAAGLGTALVASLVLTAAVGAPAAHARKCDRVTVGSIQAVAVEAHNGLSCRQARAQIRRWFRQGSIPRAEQAGPDTGWWGCSAPSMRRDRRYLCSPGAGGRAPYLLFRTRE
jgi:hypothetical protein